MQKGQSKSLSEKRKKAEQKKPGDQKTRNLKDTEARVVDSYDGFNWYPDQLFF